METYTYKYREFKLTPEPNDVTIDILSYLSDTNGFPLLNSINEIDFFTVTLKKSSLPVSGFESFLSIAVISEIASHFNKTISGSILSGETIITGLSDTFGVFPGMRIVNSNVSNGTLVGSIRDSYSVRMDSPAASTVENQPFEFDTLGWTLDLTDVAFLVSVVDFSNLNI